ncbi:MAG TPA: hypothetical protein VHJ34_07755 [Actinomycetota bacterium]|nr:hypothetical protein [Actinomycetota bacterium]
MNSDRFKPLYDALSAWAEQTSWGSLDQEARIKELVASDPPLDRASEAYIEQSLSDPVTARFFTDHAESAAWLKWVEEKGLLTTLFGSNELPAEVARTVAYWFADKYACAHSETALGVVQRAGRPMGEFLWNALALFLHPIRCNDVPVIEKWLPVLLQHAPPKNRRHSVLETMLTSRVLSRPSVLLLFGFLVQPLASLSPRFVLGDDGDGPPVEVDYEVDLRGDDYWLGQIWKERIKPSLSDYVIELAPIVTSALSGCHHILRASGRATSYWDPTNYQRVAVEDQAIGGGVRHPVDPLIDAARDIVEHLLTTQIDRAKSLITDWLASESPLLQRLAVHAYVERQDLSADEKLAFVLEADLLYAEPLRHEVFRLLRLNFKPAEDEVRNRVLDVAVRGPQGEHADRLREDALDYVKYNLLYWLHQAAPDDPRSKELLDEVHAANPDFEPRDNPDLAWVISMGPHEVESPLTVEELQDIDPRRDVTRLVQAVESADDYSEREALLGAISAAVRRDFAWSASLAGGLHDAGSWESPIWGALISGWASSEHSAEDWNLLLDLLLSHEELDHVADQLAYMLVNLARSSMPTFGPKQFEKAEQLHDAVWSSLEVTSETVPSEARHDLLSEAINRAGGRLAEFLIRRIDAKRRLAGEDAITAQDQTRLSRICDGTTHSHLLGLVVVAQDVVFLYSLDSEWTLQKLLPTFEWESEERAKAAWNGYLWGPRWHRRLLPPLIPLIQETFDHLDALGDEHRRQLAALVAGISVHAMDDAMSRPEWLRKYLATGEDTDRAAIAYGIAAALEPLDDEAVRDVWKHWLREYVSERMGDVPAVADEEELRALHELVMPLKVVLGELVPLLKSRTPVDTRYSRIYDRMSASTFSREEADAAAELLEHLLAGAGTPFFNCHEVGLLVTSLHMAGAPRDVLVRICNRMSELGCGEAITLRATIEGS